MCKHAHKRTFLCCFAVNKPPCIVCSGGLSPSGAQCSFSRINHANLSRTVINHLRLCETVFVCALKPACSSFVACLCLCVYDFLLFCCFLFFFICAAVWCTYHFLCDGSGDLWVHTIESVCVCLCVNKTDESDGWKQYDQCKQILCKRPVGAAVELRLKVFPSVFVQYVGVV